MSKVGASKQPRRFVITYSLDLSSGRAVDAMEVEVSSANKTCDDGWRTRTSAKSAYRMRRVWPSTYPSTVGSKRLPPRNQQRLQWSDTLEGASVNTEMIKSPAVVARTGPDSSWVDVDISRRTRNGCRKEHTWELVVDGVDVLPKET